jgi:hypothetical protein
MTLLPSPGRVRGRLFAIADDDVTFRRRGFHQGNPAIQRRLEGIGREFLRGYHAAIESGGPDGVLPALHASCGEFQGFAFEGAAMALALLDLLTPWRRDRVRRFLAGPGDPHAYMVHVGVGWALARARRRRAGPPAGLDPLLGWLAFDGLGFHQGYFAPDRYIRAQELPPVSGYASQVFDQGLGRSLWFVDCGDVTRIPRTIAAFPPTRQDDLWSGVGLAAAYAGGAERDDLIDLREAAGAAIPHLAQGVAFAAKARERAGNPSRFTQLAAETICGISASAAAEITDLALADARSVSAAIAYDVWRSGIRTRLARIAEEGGIPSWTTGPSGYRPFVAMPLGVSPFSSWSLSTSSPGSQSWESRHRRP